MSNPILLIQAEAYEWSRKSGGGGAKPPIVDVTPELRALLGVQVSQLVARAESVGASQADPLPVLIRLRSQALAKSNRPYALLASVGLTPVAATKPNHLIVAGTVKSLRALESTIRSSKRKTDTYPISTFESFSEWDSFAESVILSGEESVGAIVQRAISEERSLLVTFFPWVSEEVRRSADRQALGGQPQSVKNAVEQLRSVYGSEVAVAGLRTERPYVYVTPKQGFAVGELRVIRGVRTMTLAPQYGNFKTVPQGMKFIRDLTPAEFVLPAQDDPLVGILDSGISGDFIEPAVVGREIFDPPSDRDPTHGTFVAGLAIASRQFNDDTHFPEDKCRVFDGQVLPSSPVNEDLLLERIIAVVEQNPQIKVWNCSFGAPTRGEPAYGVFAQELDLLSRRMNVLFVQAAGNYSDFPMRGWPPAELDNMLMSPAEAVSSLTVGARAHKGGYVPVGKPSSYSRRGPNFASHTKPEVCHWAGDLDSSGQLTGQGIYSTIPQGAVAEGIGTSFSTPIVASVAANVWQEVDRGSATGASPELVRGLLVHAAALADTSTEDEYRDYYGWGVPPSSAEVLSNLDSGFTSVHEVLLPPGVKWTKAPFPVPASLLTSAGKFRGEVIVTVAYAPPINPAFGAEAVRYDVHGAFGRMAGSEFEGITTPDVPERPRWESDRVRDGKWSPIKTYRKRAPQGVAGEEWALRLEMTERVQDEVSFEQRVFAIVTLRSMDLNDGKVYQEGLAAVTRLNYRSQRLTQDSTVRVNRQA